MTSYFLDTNIFLRFLVTDETSHVQSKECQELFRKVKEGSLDVRTCSHVISEVVWVLRSFYKFDRDRIIKSLYVFINTGVKIDDHVDVLHALDLFEKYTIKFIDALIASHADIQNNSLILVSYDRDFDKIGIKRLEPKDL